MILFVFEGVKEEPKIMETVRRLFFNDDPDIVQCAFGSDTHTFINKVKELQQDGGEVDIFAVVKERMNSRGDHSLDGFFSSQFEATYLFFDYDPQNKTVPLKQLNDEISDAIRILSDSMDNGMIFISYPMVEALYYENSSSDENYSSYKVSIDELAHGKSWAQVYEFARKRYQVIFKTDKYNKIEIADFTPERFSTLKTNWNELIKANASKANYICNEQMLVPDHVDDITTEKIFNKQLDKYVLANNEVPVLSAFPLFLFDYFHGNGEF